MSDYRVREQGGAMGCLNTIVAIIGFIIFIGIMMHMCNQ
jgi:hypothetical protein